MRGLTLRGPTGALLCAALIAAVSFGCAPEDPLTRGVRYLEDRDYRRSELERSLVRPERGYGALRLARYATDEGGWDALQAWDPPVRAVTTDDIGRYRSEPGEPSEAPLAPVLGDGVALDEEALLELGRRAFDLFPVQLNATIGTGVEDEATIERYGLSVDDAGRIGGLVRVALPDGAERFAVTCATCHSRVVDGVRAHGPSSRLDWGALSHREAMRAGLDEERAHYLLGWGPGRVDVTPDDMDNPAAMADLRGVSRQPYLHWSATLENDVIALAIRIETLIITSMRESVRPPREVALALAFYVWSLGEGGAPGDALAHPEGAALFAAECASCHGADGVPPRGRMPAEEVGTDPDVAASSTRGTGHYRVPSLWRVGDRSPLLHDASVASLERLLDPERLAVTPGHDYGTHLAADERARLVEYLRTIGTSE